MKNPNRLRSKLTAAVPVAAFLAISLSGLVPVASAAGEPLPLKIHISHVDGAEDVNVTAPEGCSGEWISLQKFVVSCGIDSSAPAPWRCSLLVSYLGDPTTFTRKGFTECGTTRVQCSEENVEYYGWGAAYCSEHLPVPRVSSVRCIANVDMAFVVPNGPHPVLFSGTWEVVCKLEPA